MLMNIGMIGTWRMVLDGIKKRTRIINKWWQFC